MKTKFCNSWTVKQYFLMYLLFNVLPVFLYSCNTASRVAGTKTHQEWVIINPYENISWDAYGQFKANFHSHTTVSDGRLNPHEVIEMYSELGYDILAITDHNSVTYPWQAFDQFEPGPASIRRKIDNPSVMPDDFNYENRDPVVIGMIDIQGNELSRHHHIGSYFSNVDGPETEESALEAMKNKNGIGMLNHPGRYFQNRDPQLYVVQWYLNLYNAYDNLIGLEVYNQNDRFPLDRMMWDSILTVSMPDRPVWGFANDDMHASIHAGISWNMMILPELNHQEVRYSMENGHFYFVHAPEGHGGPAPPVILDITVDPGENTITITGEAYDSIKWISEGKVVAEGEVLKLHELENPGTYIRAKLYGKGESVSGTQPFGINTGNSGRMGD